MKRVCIGPIQDGKAGGIDRYILNLFENTRDEPIAFDFFTDAVHPELQAYLQERSAGLIPVSSLAHPIRQYREYRALFRSRQYDTAYFNISTALCIFGPLAAKRSGIPKIIIHSHAAGYDASSPILRAVMTFLHKVCKIVLYRFGTDFYACSESAGLWMFPKKTVRGDRFRVVNNAIHARAYAFDADTRAEVRAEYGLENRFVVGHIGNFLYPKNHTFLLDVFAEICRRDDDAMLLLVGDGALFDTMRDKAKSLGVFERVVFAGRHMNASDFLQAMDVFAFPSNFEGLGIAAVEAQAAGLRCVCSEFVPKETAVTNLCVTVPISSSDSVSQWAQTLLEAKGADRPDTGQALSDAGFDIDTMDYSKLL